MMIDYIDIDVPRQIIYAYMKDHSHYTRYSENDWFKKIKDINSPYYYEILSDENCKNMENLYREYVTKQKEEQEREDQISAAYAADFKRLLSFI